MDEHTKLPWFADNRDELAIPNNYPTTIYGEDNILIASMGYTKRAINDEANAQFIVKAANHHEELTEILQLILTRLDLEAQTKTEFPCASMRTYIRKLLAKLED